MVKTQFSMGVHCFMQGICGNNIEYPFHQKAKHCKCSNATRHTKLTWSQKSVTYA